MADTSFSSSTPKTPATIVVYGNASTAVALEVTKGNCKVRITESDVEYGDITISYTLENDRADTASLKPLYSTGGAYSEMTKGTGGDNKTGLTTSAAGTDHTFVWDTVTDLGRL